MANRVNVIDFNNADFFGKLGIVLPKVTRVFMLDRGEGKYELNIVYGPNDRDNFTAPKEEVEFMFNKLITQLNEFNGNC